MDAGESSVCVEADEIRAYEDWTSVVVLGRYVEIPNTPDNRRGWEHARALVQKRARWSQSGYNATQVRGQPRLAAPVFYCILIEQLSGLRATPDFSGSTKRRASPADAS